MTAPVLTPEFTCKLSAQSKKSVQNRILVAQYGNGYSQVVKDGINSNTDKWDLTFIPLSGTALTTLNSFFTLVGCDVWFSWVPIGETISKKFRVDKDSLQKTMINFTMYVITVKITQCFDLGV
jgi:phage-related protein